MSEALKAEKHGDKKLKSWFVFGNRHEQALEYYIRSLNMFRTLKQKKDAQRVLMKVMSCHKKLNQKLELANDYVMMYQLTNDTNDLRKAIDHYNLLGKFYFSAKYMNIIADEEPTPDNYQQAYDYYVLDNNNFSRHACLLAKANLLALKNNYIPAIDTYEAVAYDYLNNKLTCYTVKEILFKSLICHMALKHEDIASVIENYKNMDVHFETSLECYLIERLVKCVYNQNESEFKKYLKEYDDFKRLDQWYIQMFTIIKDQIQEKLIDLT